MANPTTRGGGGVVLCTLWCMCAGLVMRQYIPNLSLIGRFKTVQSGTKMPQISEFTQGNYCPLKEKKNEQDSGILI